MMLRILLAGLRDLADAARAYRWLRIDPVTFDARHCPTCGQDLGRT